MAVLTFIVLADSEDSADVHGAIGIQRGTLVAEVSALQSLRKGNTSEAIETLERHSYVTAVILLENPVWKTDLAVQMFAVELKHYRKQHAQPESKWTVTEKRLEELLKELKEGNRTIIPTGAVIVKQDSKCLYYKKQCRSCSFLSEQQIGTTLPKGMATISSDFTCPKCGKKQDVRIDIK